MQLLISPCAKLVIVGNNALGRLPLTIARILVFVHGYERSLLASHSQAYGQSISELAVADWRSLVAVTVDKSFVTVFVEPIPVGIDTRQFLLQLVYSKGADIHLEESVDHWLKQVRSE